MKVIRLGCAGLLGLALVAAVLAAVLLVYQGKRQPLGDPHYVAMGSSFAAGIGLGTQAPGSPVACMRTVNGYPQQLARNLGLPVLDVTCSGATTANVLKGGQYFQRAQLDALTRETRLVTVTTGGNDISYVGDLALMGGRNSQSVSGWLLRHFRGGPVDTQQRDYEGVRRDLVTFVNEVHRRSPDAMVVIATYPTILPPSGTCPRLGLSAQETANMRVVGERLAQATRDAAHASGAVLVDMQRLGAAHHACSAQPWVNGWVDASGTQFHPTQLGASATAEATASAIRAARGL